MFGLLRPDRERLDCRQRAAWSGHLCAACHAMARFGGKPMALLAGYDAAFWALVATAVLAPEEGPRRLPCTAVGFVKVGVAPLPPAAAETLAALNVLLVRAKLEDDRADGDGRGWLSRVLRGPGRRAREHLAGLGFPVEEVEAVPLRQARAERASPPVLEDLEDPTAGALAATFGVIARLAGRPELEAGLRDLGEALGRALYLCDAVTDLPRDVGKGRFNAVAACGRGPVQSRLRTHLDRLERALEGLLPGDRLPLARAVVAHLRTQGGLGSPRRCSAPRRPLRPRPAGYARVQCDDCGCSLCACADASACEGCWACCQCGDVCGWCCTWPFQGNSAVRAEPKQEPEDDPETTVYLD